MLRVHVEDHPAGHGPALLGGQGTEVLEVLGGRRVHGAVYGHVQERGEAEVQPLPVGVDLRQPPEAVAHDRVHLLPRLGGPEHGILLQGLPGVHRGEAGVKAPQNVHLPLHHPLLMLLGPAGRTLQLLAYHLEEQVEAVGDAVQPAFLVQRHERQRADLVARDQEADELLRHHVPEHVGSGMARGHRGQGWPEATSRNTSRPH
eukprot:768373-Hanusia_phi.AAC.4